MMKTPVLIVILDISLMMMIPVPLVEITVMNVTLLPNVLTVPQLPMPIPELSLNGQSMMVKMVKILEEF